MKGKSCSIDLISFYEVTCLVDQVKQADVISLSFSITFDTDFHSILPEKKKKKKISTQLDKNTMLQVNNWMMGHAQRVSVNKVTSSWQPVTNRVQQAQL